MRTLKKPLLLIIIFVIILVTLLALLRGSRSISDDMFDYINPDMYQAVFMTNGEVYFGSLTEANEEFLALEDIYYLRVTPNLQQVQDPETGEVLQNQEGEPQINLIKLGEELHGPEDRMVIPMTSIVYWENIEASGQVAQAIIAAQNQEVTNNNAVPAAATAVPSQALQQFQPAALDTSEEVEEEDEA